MLDALVTRCDNPQTVDNSTISGLIAVPYGSSLALRHHSPDAQQCFSSHFFIE
jgi:hypothetical protein